MLRRRSRVSPFQRDLEQRRHGQEQVAVLDQAGHFLIEEGDQQRGDVAAVGVGVGHDDDAAVAQVLVAIARAHADAERLHQVREFLVAGEFLRRGVGDVEDLAAQGQDRLDLRGHARTWRSRRPSRPRR